MQAQNRQKLAKRESSTGVITDQTVQQVAKLISEGWSIEVSCKSVGVARSTFYEYLSNNPLAQDLISVMRLGVSDRAKVNVSRAINRGNLKVSMWYLDHLQKAVSSRSGDCFCKSYLQM